MLIEIAKDIWALCFKMFFMDALIMVGFSFATQGMLEFPYNLIALGITFCIEIFKIMLWNYWRKEMLKLSMEDLKSQIIIFVIYLLVIAVLIKCIPTDLLFLGALMTTIFVYWGVSYSVASCKRKHLQEVLQAMYPDMGWSYSQIVGNDKWKMNSYETNLWKKMSEAVDRVVKDGKEGEINDAVIDWFAGVIFMTFVLEANFVGMILGNLFHGMIYG